ncbi:hypothetical protein KC318_g13508 [Hortaea werneckii]|uniref:Uncharacterized protein n=2 Tax=Hortaea werneckii TaxID=91943 RepID=A0A3M6Z3N7_HORWE|nr:hypothetical protein KC334_g15098 [Hortaea werneckii]KAI7654566.1 hypothetical protein KC318_g13508 [Hortaea werneckii]RMY09767.1 hypothetical protein D0867_08613 [Hortaea werneckii]
MPGTRRVPQVAQVEDCDSDESSVKPGTKVQARRRASSVKPLKSRHVASDPGHPGHHGTGITALNEQPSAAGSTAPKARPIIHNPASPTKKSRSASVSRPPVTERRYTLPDRQQEQTPQNPFSSATPTPQQVYAQQYAAWAAKYPEAARQHQQQLHAQRAAADAQAKSKAQATHPPRPSLSTVQRSRTHSNARPSRPVSIHGYDIPGASTSMQTGPPPSPSAYQNYWAAYYQQYPHQQQYQYQYHQPLNYLSGTPPAQTHPPYMNHPPGAGPPHEISQLGSRSQQQGTPDYSPRHVSHETSGLTRDFAKLTTAPQAGPMQMYSARHSLTSQMPGTFPGEESAVSDSASSWDGSQSEDSEEEEKYEHEQRRKRDSKVLPPPPPAAVTRRPSMRSRNTAPVALPGRHLRQKSHHMPRSDTGVEYPSSSEQFDSDRARVGRTRTGSSYSGRSRRESVSTAASSGRTKATSVSAGSGLQKVILEDKYGRRRTAYISPEQQSYLAHAYERSRREEQERQDTIERYQQDVSGARKDLTVDNVSSLRRTSGSHMSQGSHKSSSSRASRSDGIKIQSGETVLHVYGEASVEMVPQEHGGPAVIKIGSGMSSTRDSGYHGSSRGSGSRLSKRLELPQDGYESGH